MTVITVMIIAALGVVIVAVVIPVMKGSLGNSAKCAAAYGCDPNDDGKTAECKYMAEDDNGNFTEADITCPLNK